MSVENIALFLCEAVASFFRLCFLDTLHNNNSLASFPGIKLTYVVVVCTKKSEEPSLSSLLSIHNVMVDHRIIPSCKIIGEKEGKNKKKTTCLCVCPIAAQANPLVTPSHHAVNSVAKRMHGCGIRLKTSTLPPPPPLSPYVLATCPCHLPPLLP